MAQKLDNLLAEYGESHQNPLNKAIHWICVPVIAWCVLALLHDIPVPAVLARYPPFSWLNLVLLLVLGYYVVMSWRLAIGFGVFAAICYWLLVLYVRTYDFALWKFALIVFVLAWIGQFWGHKIEGKKPSFFKDVQFLLIGPAWLLHFLYKRAGIAY